MPGQSYEKEITSYAEQLGQLTRQTKRLLMIGADVALLPLSLFVAKLITVGLAGALNVTQLWVYPTVVLISVPCLASVGLYRSVVRFMGQDVVFNVLKGMTVATVTFGLLSWAIMFASGMPAPNLGTLVAFWAFAVLASGGIRFLARYFLQRQRQTGDRVAIYGAGGAGARLASALTGGQEFVPVAFIDDNPAIQNSEINGLKVHAPQELPHLLQELGISRVLLALPSVSRRRRRNILEQLEILPVHVQTMPNFSDLISGYASVDEIREVEVSDLLGRDAVPPDPSLLGACIEDKIVMVTGAGGSIGSELCRQILRKEPRRLILFEVAEAALYTIDKQLKELQTLESTNIEVVPLIGSVCDRACVGHVLKSFGVNTIYHAAAYKHVPLVEQNIIAGVENNVLGTHTVAAAAVEHGVETLILVSTDKAVCPTNVMGATKRLAELVLQGLHSLETTTRLCMVRFGNVLASSGSVVPVFREQIRRGGPVTVTHPEIIRYFMTIPEAAQLVIQAGSMSQGGDVFLLDMGKPVKIDDLARRMIHLMGLEVYDSNNPDGDIRIEYTGLRPAEKLYEELLIGNNAAGTDHPMIMRAEEESLDWPTVEGILRQLQTLIATRDCQGLRDYMEKIVGGYTPMQDLCDLVWMQENSKDVVKRRPPAVITHISGMRKH